MGGEGLGETDEMVEDSEIEKGITSGTGTWMVSGVEEIGMPETDSRISFVWMVGINIECTMCSSDL